MGNACLRTAAEGSAACGAALTEYAVKEERRSHMKQPKVSVIIPVYNLVWTMCSDGITGDSACAIVVSELQRRRTAR